jgi:hypothetical protein
MTVLIVPGLFPGTMVVTMSAVGVVCAVALMKLFRLLEIMAFTGNTKEAKGEGNQGKFHRGTSIATRRPKAIPKVEFSRKPLRHNSRRPSVGSELAQFRGGLSQPRLQ